MDRAEACRLRWTAQKHGRKELPPLPRSGAAAPCPRSGAVAQRINPTSKEQRLRGRRRAELSYSMFRVRRGSREEEQRLRFAGGAMKRNPSKMVSVARGHQRADTLKP